jgi:hypothetical protein
MKKAGEKSDLGFFVGRNHMKKSILISPAVFHFSAVLPHRNRLLSFGIEYNIALSA